MNDNESKKIILKGRIDSSNAQETETRIMSELSGNNASLSLILDASSLEYISSAGLRVILRLKKSFPDLMIENVNPEVYDILEMTGFTELMTVSKAYRVVSIDGCEEIGRGSNGIIYRIDKDNVVKVYNDANALEEIQHEREMAKLALILGIPTAISYDVVKVGNSYGSVFELLNARSFSKILATEPEKFDMCAFEFAELLKKIHGTKVPHGKLSDVKDVTLERVNFLKDYLPEVYFKKLHSLVSEVPYVDTMIHGDYHTKNLELQNDEVLLIDMDTLAVGHPIFELGSMYNAFVGFSEYNHEIIKSFQGFDFETGKAFWHKSLALYLGTDNPEKLKEVEDKARIIGYSRIIRRSIRRGCNKTEDGKKELELWTRELTELLDRTDTLLFDVNEIVTEALTDNLPKVISFIEERLEKAGCPLKASMQICVAAEEIYVNIAHYAYSSGKGNASVRVDITGDIATFTFTDSGVPFNPLEKKDPDVTLSASERQEGGLGIFMVKKTMDDVRYERRDGKNVLAFSKKFK